MTRQHCATHLRHDILRVQVVHGAADTLGGAQHLLTGACKSLGTAARAHHTSNLNDIIHADVASVLDVFLLQVGWTQ
jgi:hypothetical protein